MIRNTEEFLAALRAARRASTRWSQSAQQIRPARFALTTRSLNGNGDASSLLSWTS